ncbi:MAG: LLM class flavin-dependent oxidoreductase [Actinomycetia bacterium]|nr:LLM class flavin-dependent oxidoreductase [Actinomycetes bacterium]
MKISMFHLMPYRGLPDDFESRYRSVWVDPPWSELADPELAGRYYNWTFDELLHAADVGLDGICVNEHHQNAYGFMPSPNLMGSVLARATNGTDVAIVQMGSTLPSTSPPTRIAEEYAMLDCISGGRLVAGMPIGSAMDVNLCYGITPVEQRERYAEAHDLILKAWRHDQETFAWNGKYFQLGMVNLWPRPIQQPAPPVWLPGAGSSSTWARAAEHDHCYCFLSYYGNEFGKKMMDGFWEFVDRQGLDQNPYRAGFLQLVVVSETDASAEREYYPHIRYFFDKCQHIPTEYFWPPGHQDYASLRRSTGIQKQLEGLANNRDWSFSEFVDRQVVIGGSPASVRDQLAAAIKQIQVGNLMVLLHIGSMPHELTIKNIELFGREVLPHLRSIWTDEWENHWWPERLRGPRAGTATSGASLR